MKLHLIWHYAFHFKCIIGFFFGKPPILCNKSLAQAQKEGLSMRSGDGSVGKMLALGA